MLNLWHAYIRAAQVGWDANAVVAMRLMRLTVGGALAQRFRSPTMLASPVAAAQTSIVVLSFMAIAQAPDLSWRQRPHVRYAGVIRTT